MEVRNKYGTVNTVIIMRSLIQRIKGYHCEIKIFRKVFLKGNPVSFLTVNFPMISDRTVAAKDG